MKKLIFVIALFALGACSTMKITHDYDKTVDFTQFKTAAYYGWEENSDAILNRFDKERIENAFAEEFNSRGIQIVDKGNADLIVSLYVATEQKTQKTATTSHLGGGFYDGYYGPGWGWGGGHSTTHFNEYDYEVGTLIVSIYDARKKELIWQGVGEDTIEENAKRREQKIQYIAASIMKNYPV